jgi:hypothetical protein
VDPILGLSHHVMAELISVIAATPLSCAHGILRARLPRSSDLQDDHHLPRPQRRYLHPRDCGHHQWPVRQLTQIPGSPARELPRQLAGVQAHECRREKSNNLRVLHAMLINSLQLEFLANVVTFLAACNVVQDIPVQNLSVPYVDCWVESAVVAKTTRSQLV